MGKNIKDYQSCQQRKPADNRDISVGRRFKPDLGHHHPSPGIASIAPDEPAGPGLVPVKPCTYHILP